MDNLLEYNLQELTEYIKKFGHKPYRAKQLLRWIYHFNEDHFELMSDVAKSFQDTLKNNAKIVTPEITFDHLSLDGTRKWLLDVGGKNGIETVFIPEEDRGTLCISSQVGCALECTFCSTGRQGFNRNLTSGEIIGQLWLANKLLRKQENYNHLDLQKRVISNVVMMGMGEPLLNFEPVVNAMDLMTDDHAYGLSKRKVTISTSGIVPKIDDLSKVSDVALTISLHAPNDELRNELVPINKKYPIQELLDSVKRYVDSCDDKRITTIEYILIDGINDELSHAEELADLLRQLPSKINLIPFNAFEGSNYLKPSGNRVKRFQKYLQGEGYVTTIRSTRGDDIMAACGQLVGQVNDKTRRKERSQKNQIKTRAI